MSVKRVYYVEHARQKYGRTSSGERTPVLRKDGTPKMGRGGVPMTRRVTTADKSRPLPLDKCGKCGVEIKVGDPYLYWEPYFRSNYRAIRCRKPQCFPRPSERESSAMATVLSAQESVEDALAEGGQESASDFEDLANQVVEALDEVIEQYQEADEAFGGQGATESAQRAEDLESAKSDLESASFDDPPERDEADACDNDEHDENTEGCEDCEALFAEALDTWREEQKSNLEDLLSNIG